MSLARVLGRPARGLHSTAGAGGGESSAAEAEAAIARQKIERVAMRVRAFMAGFSEKGSPDAMEWEGGRGA